MEHRKPKENRAYQEMLQAAVERLKVRGLLQKAEPSFTGRKRVWKYKVFRKI